MRSWGSSRFRRWAERTFHDARDPDRVRLEGWRMIVAKEDQQPEIESSFETLDRKSTT